MTSVAVATSSQLAADAAREVAAGGGNAVDCALAASLLTMNTEPGVCALAGSAFITIWPAGSEPVTIDGNVAVPGAGLAEEERGQGAVHVSLDYGGGINTLVGPGSVSIPGSLARIPVAYYLAIDLGMGVSGVWWAVSITTLIKAGLLAYWFQKGNWKTKQV